MEIIWRKIEEIIPYERNQKKHDAKQVANVANSIKRFGWQQPIVVDSKDVVIIGHCRLLAAKKLGFEEVPVTVAGNLTEDEVRELRIADNKTNESEWDFEMLKIDLPELKFEGFDFGNFEFHADNGFDVDSFIANARNDYEGSYEPSEDDEGPYNNEYEDETEAVNPSTVLDTEKYSAKLGEVIYEPKETHHQVSDLFEENTNFYEEISQIENPELRKMLTLRAAWFCQFKFNKIADYYAYQATAQEQHIIERLGLVLLDRDQLIEHNFADLMEDVDTDRAVNDDDEM